MCYNEFYYEQGFLSGLFLFVFLFVFGLIIAFLMLEIKKIYLKVKQRQEEQEDLERKRKAKEVNDYIDSHSKFLSLKYGIPRYIIIDIYTDIFSKLNEVEGKKK